MAILLARDTTAIIQGMTGHEGMRILRAMRDYYTYVVAGVTPGKGGTEVEGAPVFNSVAEAVAKFRNITASVVSVPPARAKDAIMEAIQSNIKLIHVLVEHMPIRDAAYVLSATRERGLRILGPASIGAIAPGIGRIGIIGGFEPDDIYRPGTIGIISRSGGMANELAWAVRCAGLGQSTVVGIGGEVLIGTTFADLLQDFENDPQTEAIVIFGELGGQQEYEIIELRERGIITKPIAMHIAGSFASVLPLGTSFGHAGAIVEQGRGSVAAKEAALLGAGIAVAQTVYDLPDMIRSVVTV